MDCNLPEDGQSTANCLTFPARLFPDKPTKWELTRKAIEAGLEELYEAGTASAGLMLFPRPGSLCNVTREPDVEIAPLTAKHRDRLFAAMASGAPSGETPLAGATILSYAHLLDEMRSGRIVGEAFVVVITDGYETCKTDEQDKLVDSDIPNARRLLGVRTFVIGAPGSDEGRALLSSMAVAGTTEVSGDCTYGPGPTDGNCHYDMSSSEDFAEDLLAALTKVNAEVLSCSLELPEAPSGENLDLTKVNVLVNGKSRPMVREGSCPRTNGWRYSSDYSSIELCGDVCRDAKEKGAEVRIILGCPTTIF